MAKRVFSVFLILVVGFWILFFLWSPSFLNYNHPVASNYVILEGWLPPFELEQSVKQLYVTGKTTFIISGKNFKKNDTEILSRTNKYFEQNNDFVRKFDRGIWLLTNAVIFFNVTPFLQNQIPQDTMFISFRIKGSVASGHPAHFKVYINNEHFFQGFISHEEETLNLAWPKSKGTLTSLAIQFDNDLRTEDADRNLKVIGLNINNQEFPLNSKSIFYLQHEDLSVYGFNSEIAFVKNYLLELGVNEKDLVLLEFEPAKRNQTLKSAQLCADWAIQQKISSINVVSSGIHSRRSWVTYKKTFPKQIEVGVISFQTESSNQNQLYYSFYGIKSALEELFTYVWNWLQLSFYSCFI